MEKQSTTGLTNHLNKNSHACEHGCFFHIKFSHPDTALLFSSSPQTSKQALYAFVLSKPFPIRYNK